VTVRLVLPLPPNAANLRRHWRVALKEKKAYWRTLNMLAAAARFPVPPAPFDPARISAHLFVWNPMDDDNAMHRMKVVLDWLKGPYIVDDSRKHLQWAGVPEQTIDRRNPRVEVTVSRWMEGEE
jgi:hypothetical protein